MSATITAPTGRTMRPYQSEDMGRILTEWECGRTRTALVWATGLGKTDGIAYQATHAIHEAEHPDDWVLVLAHRRKLLDQITTRCAMYDPNISVGIVQGQDKNQIRRRIVVASEPTMRRGHRRAQLLAAHGGRRPRVVIVDECFPAGTLVGDVPIESIRTGDYVESWDELAAAPVRRRVAGTMRSRPSSLVKVQTDRGDIVCTPGHPFLTTDGWLPAGELPRGALVLSFTHDAAAVHGVQDAGRVGDQGAAGPVATSGADLLLDGLPERVGRPGQLGADVAHQPGARVGADAATQPDARPGRTGEDVGHVAGDRAPASPAGRERFGDARGSARVGRPARLADGGHLPHPDRRAAVSLQAGHRAPGDEGMRRGRRRVALLAPNFRRPTGRAVEVARVAGVQVLEPGRDGTYGGVCPGGVVYNLEVEGTHTYRVGPAGLVAHNCHHAAAKGYVETLRWAGCFDQDAPTPLLGVTATFLRGDNKGLGDIFQSVAAERDILFGIENGFLVMPRAWEVVGEHLDLGQVKTTAGDYAKGALGDMVEQDAGHIVAAWLEKARQPEAPSGYRTTVAFTPSVKAAEALAAEFVGAGIRAGIVTGAMGEAEQDARYAELESDKITVLCSVMVPTEGWDCPRVSCVLNARPTKQSGLYAQMIGRGLRLWLEAVACGHPEKVDCLVLDVVGASSRNRLVGLTELVPSAPTASERDILPCIQCGGYRVRPPDVADEWPRCECPRIERDEGSGRQRLRGPGIYGEVDLLGLRATSELNWLTTRGGVDFLFAGKWLIGVIEDGERDGVPTYSVGYTPVRGGAVDPREVEIGVLAPNRSGVTLCEAVPLEEAQQAAEWFARKHDARPQTAAWLTARKSPSPQQIRFALDLGVTHPELYTSGGLSDQIDIARASRRFDG